MWIFASVLISLGVLGINNCKQTSHATTPSSIIHKRDLSKSVEEAIDVKNPSKLFSIASGSIDANTRLVKPVKIEDHYLTSESRSGKKIQSDHDSSKKGISLF